MGEFSSFPSYTGVPWEERGQGEGGEVTPLSLGVVFLVTETLIVSVGLKEPLQLACHWNVSFEVEVGRGISSGRTPLPSVMKSCFQLWLCVKGKGGVMSQSLSHVSV